MNKQRNYDALLIRAFREDITLAQLYYWLKPYGIALPDPELVRQPPPAKMRVQVFVASFLRPLADRLWDTERSEDIKTLDWMTRLKSEKWGNRVVEQERKRMKREDTLFFGKKKIMSELMSRDKANNQWHVTKPPTKVRRVK